MSADLEVAPGIVIPADELSFEAVRSGGPGGQNVNKVATAVLLRFDLQGSRVLSQQQKQRVFEQLAQRVDRTGRLLVRASSERQQSRNLELARQRLAELIAGALHRPEARRATRPSRGSKRRRLQEKRRHSERKSRRRTQGDE